MRRCGHNPTDIEVSDIINKIHDDSGSLDLEVRFFLDLISKFIQIVNILFRTFTV